jgi:hypothetical protein
VLGEVRIEEDGEAVYANVTARLDRVLLAVGGPYLVGLRGRASAIGVARKASQDASSLSSPIMKDKTQ